MIEMNYPLEKAAHWYKPKRLALYFRAGMSHRTSSIMAVKMSLTSSLSATKHECSLKSIYRLFQWPGRFFVSDSGLG